MGRKKTIDDKTLLGHARAVFLERGAFGSTKEIAERAGISEAALFKRYPTKATLFLNALMPRDEDACVVVASDLSDTREALVEIGLRILDHFRSIIPAAMHLMMHPAIKMPDVMNHFGEKRLHRLAGDLAGFLRQRRDAGLIGTDNPEAAANLLIAAVHSLAVFEMMDLHGGGTFDHAVSVFVDALWSGLAPGQCHKAE